MLGINDTDTLKLGDKYVLYKLDIETGMYWLFDIESGSYFDLNETSFYILSELDGKKTLADIKERTLETYPRIDSNEISKDIDELVSKLIEKKVLLNKEVKKWVPKEKI